jgi:hypothetical protein
VNAPTDALARARIVLQRLQSVSESERPHCEVSEVSEESPSIAVEAQGPGDPFVRWRLQNAERLTSADLAVGRDPGGYCTEHHRALSYSEQKRGACSWCVAVDPETEPEYWESHWKRFRRRDDGANSGRAREE